MKSNTKKLIGAIVIVLLLCVGVLMYISYNKATGYVATVGSEKITKADYGFFLTAVKNEYEINGGVDYKSNKDKKEFWKTSINGKNAEVSAKDDALAEVQKFKIMLIKAKENNITLDDTDLQQVKATIDELISSEGSGDKRIANTSIKRKYGITLDQYENIYRDYVLALGKYASIEAGKVEISDEELKKQYTEAMNKEGKVTVWEAFFSNLDKDGKALDKDKLGEKKSLAEEMLSKAKSGEDFLSLATQYTEDEKGKENGGEFTVSKSDNMPEAYMNWVYSASEGDISLVETEKGFYVIKRPLFDELKDTLKRTYQMDKVDQMIEQWIKDEKFKIVKNEKVFNKIKIMK